MERLPKRYFLSRIIIASACSVILMFIALGPIFGMLIKFVQSGYKTAPPLDDPQIAALIPKTVFITLLAIGFAIYSVVLMLICLYRSWQAIQDHETRTTPGTAVGFLFIPLYNLYWWFRAIGDFPNEYNNYTNRHQLQPPILGHGAYRGLAWLHLAGALIPYAIFITGLFEAYLIFVLIGRTCDAVNALDTAPAIVSAPVASGPSTIPPLEQSNFLNPPPARAVVHCSKCGQPSTYGLLICLACGAALEFSKPEPTPTPEAAVPPVAEPPAPAPPASDTTAPAPAAPEPPVQPPPLPQATAPVPPPPPAAAAAPQPTEWRVESHSLTDAPPLNAAPKPPAPAGPGPLPSNTASALQQSETAPYQPNQAEQPGLGFASPTNASPFTADSGPPAGVSPTMAATPTPAPPTEAPPPQPAAAEPPARQVDQLTAILTQEPKSPALMKLLHLPRANDLATLRYVSQPLNLINVEGAQEQFNPQDYTEADLLWAEGVMALMAKIKSKIVTGDFTEVLSLILKGLELAPGEEKLLLALSDCYTELGEFGRAIKVLESAQRLYPDNSRIQLNLELVRAKIG